MALLAGLVALTTLSVTVAHAATSYKVFTGYANLRTESQFPNPWPDSSGNLPANTVYFGNTSAKDAIDPDMSGVRIDNTSSVPIVVNDVSVRCSNATYDFGGPGAGAPLAAGSRLIDGGTTRLDGSDACTVPVTVTVTLDGVAATYQDNQAAGNAGGSGIHGSPTVVDVNGTDTMESTPWTQIGAVSPSPSPSASAAAATVGLPHSGGPAAPGLGDSRWLLLAAVGALAALTLVFLKERRHT
jgi:hypothetical protein